MCLSLIICFFFFQAEDGIRDTSVTGVQTCALPICSVQVSDVKGTLEVRNRFGSITTRDIQGAATITGGNGAVTLANAASAIVTTSFGSVDAGNIRGDLSIRNKHGQVAHSTIGRSAYRQNTFVARS